MAWECPAPDTMADVAMMLNEYYRNLRQSGFTRHEALHLVMGDACCKRDDE